MALLVGELALRAWFTFHVDYDMEMWRYAAKLKEAVDDPRSHVHRRSSSARLMGVDVRTNSHGLRDVERETKKESGAWRALAIGDSFTFGWGVPFEEIFPRRLERLLNDGRAGGPRVEIVNFGIGNYNTEQELAALRQRGFEWAPDAVFLFWYLNDAEATQRHHLGWLTGHSYLAAFLWQRRTQLEVLSSSARQWEETYRSLYSEERWPRYEETLRRFIAEVRGRGLTLVPVLLPDLRDPDRDPFAEVYARVAGVFRAAGVEPLDLRQIVRGSPGKHWVSHDDPHPDSEAHRLIAEAVAEHVRKTGALP